MAIFSKILTKTDIEKRLSVPSVKKKCFLNFGDQHKVEFKVKDKNGRVWRFGGSIRKKGKFPKPVLSKGWLQFVRWWKLAIDDEVILYKEHDEAGKGYYRIEVIKRANQPSGVQSHDSDRTTRVASYSNIEDEPTLTSQSTDQAITYDQTEGLHNQPVTDRVGSEFEFICPERHMQVREPKFIDFLGLES